ncbi:hypothetical protein BHE74_00054070 [Ensete ventricosum]|nr:hypothetical protein BHE74_00054070 [Ensete ventricosum]
MLVHWYGSGPGVLVYQISVTGLLGYRCVDRPLSGGTAKFARWRSIEGEKGKKKKRKRRKKKNNTSPRPRPHAVAARGSPSSRRCPRVACG